MPSDEELVSAFKGWSEAAFKELVIRYQRPLYNFLCQRVKDVDDAADLVQHTLMQAFSKITQFDDILSFKAWLYKIALNLSKNHFRSKERQRIDQTREPERLDIADTKQPYNHRLYDEQTNVLKEAIEQLPDRQKLALKLRVFHELSYEEISAAMDCPVGTAKANFHHATKSLRSILGESSDAL